MYFELFIDTCAPGCTAHALDAVAARASAGDNHALEAAWSTEFGEADQVLSLWSAPQGPGSRRTEHDDLPATVSRDIRVLRAEMPFDRAFTGGHVYDMRVYTLHVGMRETFMAHMREALPARMKHSRNVGVWTPLTGNRDQVIHVWAYRDLAERNAARAAAWQESSWQGYLKEIFPLTLRMRNALLVPASFSPMQ